MSDHLPECPVPEMDGLWGLPMHPEDAKANCICPQLRACEQRVFQEQIEGKQHDMMMAYLRGIDAARDAVAAVGVRTDTSHDMRVHALAAIDALRGSGNPDTPPSAEKGEQA